MNGVNIILLMSGGTKMGACGARRCWRMSPPASKYSNLYLGCSSKVDN